MKYMKMLGLVAVAAAALMAFAGSASATELYGGTGTLKNPTLDFSLKSGTSASLVNTAGESLDTCTESTVKGTATTGSSTTNPTGSITTLSWGKCTFTTDTVTLGKLEVVHNTGTTNGTVKADAEIGVTINTVFFGSCVYGVKSGTTLGTLTGNAAGSATFDANAVAVKLTGSAFACPETSNWTGTYVSTEPAGALYVEAS
jgi:hypothetical protein